MTAQDKAVEISRLERLRDQRKGQPGWSHNVRAIEAKIAELKEAAK